MRWLGRTTWCFPSWRRSPSTCSSAGWTGLASAARSRASAGRANSERRRLEHVRHPPTPPMVFTVLYLDLGWKIPRETKMASLDLSWPCHSMFVCFFCFLLDLPLSSRSPL